MGFNLNDMANKHGTDKGDGMYDRHDYATTYDQLITKIIRTVSENHVRMLEIGVWDPRNPGASVRMWRDFLPLAEIHGVDVAPGCLCLEKECGARIHLVNQGDIEAMNKLALEVGALDFVVDDGSHIAGHQEVSFRALWPSIKPGGFYAIEDLQASQAAPRGVLVSLAESLGARILPGTADKLLIALR
jgi:8-demethyl-8-(2-methoxy-alpha-L-rhamnosyl)tetracenomycin-C 3'-O-methyltransferase